MMSTFKTLALLLGLLALGTNLSAAPVSEEKLAQALMRYPEADLNGDGELTMEEIQQFRQSKQKPTSPVTPGKHTETVDTKLTETLAGMNAGFENIELELLEWPDELQGKLGVIKNLALLARPVEKVEGKLPLLINLHGEGPRWWEMSLTEQLAFSAQGKMMRGFDLAEVGGKPLIVLEPNTAGQWDPAALDTMLDYVLDTYPEMDADRVYLVGYSMGGKGAWDWINASAGRFAAAAPGGLGGGAHGGDMDKLSKLPIWGMAGGDDGNNTTEMRIMVERLEEAESQGDEMTCHELKMRIRWVQSRVGNENPPGGISQGYSFSRGWRIEPISQILYGRLLDGSLRGVEG